MSSAPTSQIVLQTGHFSIRAPFLPTNLPAKKKSATVRRAARWTSPSTEGQPDPSPFTGRMQRGTIGEHDQMPFTIAPEAGWCIFAPVRSEALALAVNHQITVEDGLPFLGYVLFGQLGCVGLVIFAAATISDLVRIALGYPP